jgi:arylsulfatase A-like enzyme
MPRSSLLLLVCLGCLIAVEGRRPHIVIILTDDQGYGDLSCHGHPVLKTPNLDRLHAEGVRFTDFHVSPTCAPTRSALLTGRHEFRNGVTHTIYERERLRLDAVTLPQVLKRAGYRTGIFGKWHLGDEDAYQPQRRGFDEVFIHGGGGIGQSYPGSCGDAPGNLYQDPWVRHNGTFVKTRGYCTDVFFAEAARWVAATKDRPFFTWIATNAPHTPLQVRPEDEARLLPHVQAGRITPEVAKYLGMIANIDDNVGRLLATLDRLELTRDTLVVFMNDNGAWNRGAAVFNAGMRGHKNTAWLGGTRASSFWRWPGTLQPGDVPALTAHVDIFRTLAGIAGVPLSPAEEAQAEGRSLIPLLRDAAAPWAERTLVTHEGRWKPGTAPESYKYRNCSVRSGRWHLVSVGGDGTKPAWQLFDVVADPGEQTDVAAANAAVVARLASDFETWWTSVRPQMVNEDAPGPAENPWHVAFRAQHGAVK